MPFKKAIKIQFVMLFTEINIFYMYVISRTLEKIRLYAAQKKEV